MFEFLQVVSDSLSPCSYLADKTARLPLHLPVQPITSEKFDRLMELGYRRSGRYYYRTQCPKCSACEPIRLEAQRFEPSRSHRRTLKRSKALRCIWSRPSVDQARVDLFNRHRIGRDLSLSGELITQEDYESFLLCSPNVSAELSIWKGDELICVSITDMGKNCFSAVYCCYDPAYAQYSLGTLSILLQLQVAREQDIRWLYLGFYVRENKHLKYKANFRPHQRRINGQWIDFPADHATPD